MFTGRVRLSECPTCGSFEIGPVRRDVSGKFAGRPFLARNVEFLECRACGERLYDRVAMRQIEASYPTSARRRRA